MQTDVELPGFLNHQPLYTIHDAWCAWLAGDKFPVAFLGDSTYDGNNTTDWVQNVPGSPSGSPNAFCAQLELLLRDATGNSQASIYNAGFSGMNARWGAGMLEEIFGEQSAYHDVKMIGIGFGINDRLGYPNEQAYRAGFRQATIQIITWCLDRGIQPFLLTTQAAIAPGVQTDYIDQFPMRTSGHILTVANKVKKELAAQFGLELIDLNAHTEKLLQHSSIPSSQLISDRLHFGDLGHRAEAEFLFATFCPRVIAIDSYSQIDFSTQNLWDCIPEDWLTLPEQPADRFKVYVDHQKEDAADRRLMSAWLFIHAKKPLSLTAYRNVSPDAYVVLNGAVHRLAEAATPLGQLELGLYKLEVFSGNSERVDFKGFVLE